MICDDTDAVFEKDFINACKIDEYPELAKFEEN